MTPITVQDPRLSPPIEQWPEVDRNAFLVSVGAGRGPFQRPRAVRSPHTLAKVRRSYSRFLRYLSDTSQLYLEERPCERVTPNRLDGYFCHLRDRGNAGRTIWGLFQELQTTLRLMYPKQDFVWILKPNGVSLREMLSMRSRTIVSIDSAVLLAWAEELFEEGLAASIAARRCIKVRNAVILGLLTDRAPRLRALSLLKLGDSLKRDEIGWHLREHSEMTKMRNVHDVPVSARVGRMLDRYVDIERKELLGSRGETSAAWVNSSGDLCAVALQSMVTKAFVRRFGKRHGPHFFRHCLVTTLADQLPGHPLDGAAMIADTPAMTIKFYNHTNKVNCARRTAALLQKLRPGFVPSQGKKRLM